MNPEHIIFHAFGKLKTRLENFYLSFFKSKT